MQWLLGTGYMNTELLALVLLALVGDSKMSRLLLPLMLVRRVSADVVFASMGNHVSAAMGLRLRQFDVDGFARSKFHF